MSYLIPILYSAAFAIYAFALPHMVNMVWFDHVTVAVCAVLYKLRIKLNPFMIESATLILWPVMLVVYCVFKPSIQWLHDRYRVSYDRLRDKR